MKFPSCLLIYTITCTLSKLYSNSVQGIKIGKNYYLYAIELWFL